jgi:hypothetical protein
MDLVELKIFKAVDDKDIEEGKKIKVDLRMAPLGHKKKPGPPLAPIVTAFQKLLPRAVVKAARTAEAYGRGAVTAHNAGAALDIFYHKKDDVTRAYAHGLISLFIKHRATLQWGMIEYNQVEFSPSGAKENSADERHFDHIHVDWIDYARSHKELSKLYKKFDDTDEDGARKTKHVGKLDQRLAMYWNVGARAGTVTDFEVAFEELNRTFETQKAALAGLARVDFQATYAPPPPAIPQPQKETDLGIWLNGHGKVVHPNAPAGGGGAGHFRAVGSLTPVPLDDGAPLGAGGANA